MVAFAGIRASSPSTQLIDVQLCWRSIPSCHLLVLGRRRWPTLRVLSDYIVVFLSLIDVVCQFFRILSDYAVVFFCLRVSIALGKPSCLLPDFVH